MKTKSSRFKQRPRAFRAMTGLSIEKCKASDGNGLLKYIN